MSVEVLLEGVTPTIGEGPHWDDKTQSLLFVDILTATVYRWDSNTDTLESRKLDRGRASLIVPRESGGYVVSNGNHLEYLDWGTEQREVLAQLDHETTHVLNDGKCDARGRLWAGTVGSKPISALEDVAVEQGNLYSVDVNKRVKLQRDKLSISNGLGWTKDNKTMFYIDSYVYKVWAYDFDLEKGVISNERTVIDFESPEFTGKLSRPDGMAVDEEDKLWVALFESGKVIRIDPATGAVLQTVSLPCQRITSCCFGGRHFDELYVTSSQYRILDGEAKTSAGSVFRVSGLGVNGLPANVYRG